MAVMFYHCLLSMVGSIWHHVVLNFVVLEGRDNHDQMQYQLLTNTILHPVYSHAWLPSVLLENLAMQNQQLQILLAQALGFVILNIYHMSYLKVPNRG